MLYKTIVLELLNDRPQLREQLRQNRKLLETLNRLADELKTSHEAWKEQLSKERPGSESQISSEAMEHALQELEASLPSESDDEAFPLDQAMASLHTPPA